MAGDLLEAAPYLVGHGEEKTGLCVSREHQAQHPKGTGIQEKLATFVHSSNPWRHGQPVDGRFFDLQVDEGRKNAERNGQIPDDIVTTGLVVQVATEPHPHE